jgi:uncharacterized membrane protein YgdD (TMEM256/DUF423 family)
MIRTWLFAAAITGFVSVAGGAAAAHLTEGGRSAELLRTGALYGMVHAAALAAIAALAQTRSRPEYALIVAGWGFAAGMTVFSLSLFGLALTGIGWFGLVTPFGGVALLAGWLAFGIYAWRRKD